MTHETRSVQWQLPDAGYLFEAERDTGVRTAGLLPRQMPQGIGGDSCCD